MIHGFDISAFQGTTAPSGDYVFVKATEGKSYTSSKFPAQWKSAKTRDKHRGAYCFARPEQSSAKDHLHRFLDVVQPVRGESAMLDLEASKLTQAQTNTWARSWGDLVRDEADWLTSILYLGRGYAINGTGKDLSKHFDFWMYPQYPSAFLLRARRAVLLRGAHPRSADAPRRVPTARKTSRWPTSFSPSLPSGLTVGWSKPHLWQFTDNFGGIDASISTLTLDQLAGQSQPTPAPKPPAPPKWPGRYLQVSSPMMHGSDVKWTQQRLNAHGWALKVDSYYGPKTRDAVRTFQGHHKLTADGIVGPKTWAALAK